MSDIERLQLLTRQMHLEPTEDCQEEPFPERFQKAITVKRAQLPNGQTIRLLKTLLSSFCERSCAYCPFRAERDQPRAAFSPEEFAKLFHNLYRSGFVEGIFLSSGIFQGSRTTQDKLLDTANILRSRYSFQGYLHLKIMPGAEYEQVLEAMRLADRVSVNLEAPHPRALKFLAPEKDFQHDLMGTLGWIDSIRQQKDPRTAWKGSWPSSTTQFVVGAAAETDLDLLSTTTFLQDNHQLSRVYYSSFNPFPGTPLENQPPSSSRREHRLYQAYFLLRDYGFELEDLIYRKSGYLPLEIDPKQAWADRHLLHQPLEINTATLPDLLRVPGIGPKRAHQILRIRRGNPLRSFEQLLKARLITKISSPYLLVNGKSADRQPLLF